MSPSSYATESVTFDGAPAALDAFVSAVQAQLGKGIDAATGHRFIAYARDLIVNGG